MWIVMLNGGLGNQMFQYIFALFLAQHGARVMIDDALVTPTQTRQYVFELARFFPGGVLPRLSGHFSPDVWAEMVARSEHMVSIPEQLRDGGLSFRYVCQEGTPCHTYTGAATPIEVSDMDYVLQLPREETIYFAGYWMHLPYFTEMREAFFAQFRFPPFPRAAQARMAQEIAATRNAAAIHVRRGDMAQWGMSNPPAYFRQAIGQVERLADIEQFFLFSDDLGYCVEHAEELGLSEIRPRLTVVDGNRSDEAYVDMQLMSLCRFRIADRSSFSQLAGVLCRVPGNLTTIWQPPAVTGFGVPV